MAADRPLPADVSEAIHAFAEAHRAAAVVPEDASIREHRAAIVTCDEAYCTLVERIGSALRASRAAAPARDPEPAPRIDVPLRDGKIRRFSGREVADLIDSHLGLTFQIDQLRARLRTAGIDWTALAPAVPLARTEGPPRCATCGAPVFSDPDGTRHCACPRAPAASPVATPVTEDGGEGER